MQQSLVLVGVSLNHNEFDVVLFEIVIFYTFTYE